ncbi:ParB/RepB/Spo0J family partition protein [Marinicella meishanensis]|uniref:ParB/RepB/Spo0J family partition protein n=1 Tax=Marinicella meishanensis TaxID=2873263 RepID=UPI001CBEEEFE|nr:ParB/RepB/Spo0J family partition protein [Marinicella sp. NBU2979]
MSNVETLDIGKIEKDPNNPRLNFPESEINKLAESIDEAGVLVPVVVYQMGKKYRLLDGERRWTCCKKLGISKVPVIKIDKPTEEKRLTWMFNIHQVRERWQDMPTAIALKNLVNETGITETKELSRRTGLSTKLVKQYLYIVELPQDMQDSIANHEIAMNYFWELKLVMDSLKKNRPNIYNDYGDKELLKRFVEKRKNNVITDTVSLRNANYIIKKAAEDDPDNVNEGELDKMIRNLIDDDQMSVNDAYEESVMVAVELDKLLTKSMSVVKAFTRLLSKTQENSELKEIKEIGGRVVAQLNTALESK